MNSCIKKLNFGTLDLNFDVKKLNFEANDLNFDEKKLNFDEFGVLGFLVKWVLLSKVNIGMVSSRGLLLDNLSCWLKYVEIFPKWRLLWFFR